MDNKNVTKQEVLLTEQKIQKPSKNKLVFWGFLIKQTSPKCKNGNYERRNENDN